MAFNLQSIKATRSDQPERALFYGPHKIGKSTFAAGAPGAVVIQTEDGLDAIDVKAFPLAHSWQDILDAVSSLYQEQHDYKTVILDSADWAEKLAFAQVCSDNNVKSIESIGYGKGYTFAADLFRELMDGLNALRTQRGMRIVLLAHAEIKRFDDPQADAYDRYQIKLSKAIGKLVQEWADVIGFAQLDTIIKAEKKKGFEKGEVRNRALATGQRVLRLSNSPSYDAGNRYSLPDSIPLVWSEYETALNTARNTVKEQNNG